MLRRKTRKAVEQARLRVGLASVWLMVSGCSETTSRHARAERARVSKPSAERVESPSRERPVEWSKLAETIESPSRERPVGWSKLAETIESPSRERPVERSKLVETVESTARERLVELSRLEERLLASRDARPYVPWSQASGSNPWLIHGDLSEIADTWIGGLRGTGAVVRYVEGEPQERVQGPAGLSGWAWRDDVAYLVGEGSNTIVRIESTPRLAATGRWDVDGVWSLRDIALGPSMLLVADRDEGRIYRLTEPNALDEFGVLTPLVVGECHGVTQVDVVDDLVIANCLLEHRIRGWRIDRDTSDATPLWTIEHDGPMWAFDVQRRKHAIRLVATGIEDHPLDRREGSFGYIDSFAFVYEVSATGEIELEHAINLSESGVVTPKWVAWQNHNRFDVTAAGSSMSAWVELLDSGPKVHPVSSPAGTMAVMGAVNDGWAANPLLDGWVRFAKDDWSLVVDTTGAPIDALVRLGEALVFTTAMAPDNRSDGHFSRFTCEACHFEGTVDGRTHYTGRKDVHATTKTLRGLVGNRPHFTRALDSSTTEMIDNEFRVANRGSAREPWSALDPVQHPWITTWMDDDPIEPWVQREAVLRFLAEFEPEPNPRAQVEIRFTRLERRGAERFHAWCESCHQARLRVDDASSRLPIGAWEDALLGEGGGAVMWASEGRQKTGVEPYVHRDGARTPSLRRLARKLPYLTNGSAPSIDALLRRVDVGPPFAHGRRRGEVTHPLSKADRDALHAFLRLL